MGDPDEFYLVLPSNSSMLYAPENSTCCFTTHLSREIRLTGDWSVGLAEIHVPYTMMHFQTSDAVFNFSFGAVSTREKNSSNFALNFPSGVYESVEQLAEEINKTVEMSPVEKHQKLQPSDFKKGFFMLERKCDCSQVHETVYNEKIARVFGFESAIVEGKPTFVLSKKGESVEFDRPASLSRAIPDQLYVYTDVCVPYTVGDTQSSLLRIVSLDATKYKFGSNVVRHFAPVLYVPLLQHSFQSIVIDIRDQHGLRIPFEYGTLTVTLHFKRNR